MCACHRFEIIALSLKAWPRKVVGSLWLKAAASEGKETDMSDWLHNLPVLWMSLLVFGFTYLVTAAIYGAVSVFAVGERARSFKAISPGLLPPLGIIFALLLRSPRARFGLTPKRPERKSIARLAR